MKTPSSDRGPGTGSVRPLAVLALATVAACSDPAAFFRPQPSSAVRLLTVTGPTVVTAVVALDSPGGAAGVVGLQGRIRFDPTAVRYVGQEVDGTAILLVGDASAKSGEVRFVVLDRGPLATRAAAFQFASLRPEGVDPKLVLEVEHAGDAKTQPVRGLAGRFRAVESTVAPVVVARRMTVADWYERFQAPKAERLPGPLLSPGQGTIYGDVNLNGVVNLFDVIAILNVAAGAQPLLTDLTRDLVIAGDVAPANAPGLGEATDPIPPGLEADGSREINVFDAIAIQNFAAGVPDPVAGQPIPGRQPIGARAVLSGVLVVDRALSRDTVYELDGMVIVTAGATLRVPAGTRIEGNSTTRGALSIRRGSQLIVSGTRLEPVVMTCTAAIKAPGCWGGLQINGAASVNNGNTGGGNTVGCPELTAPGGFGIYGGCINQSTSGGITYLRIEYAGAPSGAVAIAGLQLLGVGSGTILQDIQVTKSLGTAVFVSGGFAQLRQVMLTDNGGVGFDWNDGWMGKAQQLLIHRGNAPGTGLEGSNAPPGTTVVGQISSPMLYNVTLIGPGAPGAGFPAVLLHQGTGGLLRNLVVQGFDGPGFDLNDPETCTAISGGMLSVGFGVFWQNTPDFAADVDCFDEVAYAADPGHTLGSADPLLIAPNLAGSPDARPRASSPATTGINPPADGFFDPAAAYLGAVAPTNPTTSTIPWYAGWTIGW